MYLKLEDPGTIKYTFYKDPSPKNYTPKAAVAIKKGKTAKGVLYSTAVKKTWDRYYKISVPKTQFVKVLFSTEFGYYRVNLYDSEGYYVDTSTEYDKKGNTVGIISDNKVKKGTYYIRVSSSWTQAEQRLAPGTYYSIKWK